MPPRRSSPPGKLQHSPPPPPPYDGRLGGAATAVRVPQSAIPGFERVNQQTIPKIGHAHLHRSSLELDDEPYGQKGSPTSRAARVGRSLDQHKSAAPNCPGGGRRDNNDHEFLNSLAASRSALFRYVTVEPMVFLAIIALSLEFPAIQDLIYTKICAEVVSNHPDMWIKQQQQQQQATPSGSNTSFNATLPSSGRIQQVASSANQSSLAGLASGPSQPMLTGRADLYRACDLVNKNSIAREIRQEIADINSLFWLKYQILVCSLCAIFSPYWGGVSDKIGRLLPLNAPIVASILCNSISLAFGWLIGRHSQPAIHIDWLYAGALLVGLSGGRQVLIMNAFSFVSDTTTSEQRSKRVTVLESVIFVASSIGFLLSKLITHLGVAGPEELWLNRHFVSFSACIILNCLCLVYSACRLRHQKFHKFLNNFEREQLEAAHMGSSNQMAASTTSLALVGGNERKAIETFMATNCGSCDRLRELTSNTPDDPDGPIAKTDQSDWSVWDTLITFRYYKETYKVTTKAREARTIILLLLLLGFISALSLATLMSLLFVYVKMDPFNWPTSQYSLWNAISSITRGVALVTLTLLMKFASGWRIPDGLVAALGFLAKGAGLLMIGLAQSGSLINWSLVAFSLSEFSMPPIRSLLSKLVPNEELGRIYSCLGSLQSLCFILGNVAIYLAFTTFVQADLFRLAFITVGSIELGALGLVLLVHLTIKRQILII